MVPEKQYRLWSISPIWVYSRLITGVIGSRIAASTTEPLKSIIELLNRCIHTSYPLNLSSLILYVQPPKEG